MSIDSLHQSGAVTPGRPFKITLRDDILALDADDEDRAAAMVREFIDEWQGET